MYRLRIVRFGTRETTRSGVYLHHHLYGEPDGPAVVDYFFWLVTGGGRTILVDCGFSRSAGDARGRRTIIAPRAALAALGVAPDDVDTLVVSHAHYDHVGNLDLAPRARVWIAARELEFWTSPIAGHTQFDYYCERTEIDELAGLRAEGRLTTFAGSAEPAPGLVVTEVGGHTPGQAIVELPTSAGPVLLATDCVHFHEELERRMPFVAVTDLAQMYRAYDLVDERLARTGAHLVTGHDPSTLARYPAPPEAVPEALDGLLGMIG